MSRKFIPVEEVAQEWMKRPEFVAAYDALEEEFAFRLGAHPGARACRRDAGRQVYRSRFKPVRSRRPAIK